MTKTRQQLLENFIADYDNLFEGWDSCPVISLSMLEFDCTKDSDVEYLINQIRSYVVT